MPGGEGERRGLANDGDRGGPTGGGRRVLPALSSGMRSIRGSGGGGGALLADDRAREREDEQAGGGGGGAAAEEEQQQWW